MNVACINELTDYLTTCYPHPGEAIHITLEPCPPGQKGDITINCFRLAAMVRANPLAVAEKVTAFLNNHEHIVQVESVKAFVNLSLKPAILYQATIADMTQIAGEIPLESTIRRRILVEFSSPNTNKPQHLGHIRNNMLGMAICSLLEKVGHEVIAVNLINDRGIHICKSMVAYNRFGKGLITDSAGVKGDRVVGDLYVRYEQELRKQIMQLRDSEPRLKDTSPEELFQHTEIGRAAHDMLRDWERGDLRVRSLWQRLNGWVLDGFNETYRRMGVCFDQTYFESETYKFGKELVVNGSDDGVFDKCDDGAIEIDLRDVKLDKKILLRNDGTSVYVTQDIGTTYLKHSDHNPDVMLWIVGNEQIYHFKVLFAVLEKMGFTAAKNLHHVAYGMVHLPEGKMKSREGIVVDADDLMEEMVELAKTATLARTDGRRPNDLEARATTIGLGALKFMLYKVNPKTTLKFDPNASVKFEGDTGPYVLYAYARIASILRKNNDDISTQSVNWSLLVEPEERALAVAGGMYPSVVRKAALQYDPSILANYLLTLTKEFNRFYKKHSVLSAPSAELQRSRLALCKSIQWILKDGLDTLTIGTLEEM